MRSIGRGLAALVCLGLASCDDVESTSVGSLTERTVTALGGEGHATLCEDVSLCTSLAVGDVLGAGTIDTPSGEALVFRDDAGFDWTVEANSQVELANDARLVRGSLRVESRGGVASEATLRVGNTSLLLSNEKPLKVAVSMEGQRGRVAVLRGEVVVRRGEESVALRRGQSLDLEAIEAPLSARYAEPPPIVVGEGSARSSTGLGTMTARRPGTNQSVDGMRLASHRVDAVVERGLASTVVEEVFENTTNETLEGTFTFTLPPDAIVSDLVLWVGDDPVPAEIVEKGRAKQIFKGIVDDTVRPKDPALLEWSSGQTVSLSVFPIAPKSSRRVRFRFEERLHESNGSGRYVYPFSAARATEVGSFSMRVRLLDVGDVAAEPLGPSLSPSIVTDEIGSTVTVDADRARPQQSLVVSYARPTPGVEHLVDASSGLLDRPGIMRLPVALDPEDALPLPVSGDLAIVIDRSASQSRETLTRQIEIARATIADLESSERFVLLACDSTCETFPARGLATTEMLELDRAVRWLSALQPRGASDLAASIEDASARLEASPRRRLVVLGDGIASTGSLAPHAVAARAARAVAMETDVRFVAVGTDVDLVALRALAASVDGSIHRTSESVALDAMVAALRAPLVRDLDVSLPEGVRLAAPLPETARLGEELVIHTEGAPAKPFDAVTLHGLLGHDGFQRTLSVTQVSMSDGTVGRFVARDRISRLEGEAGRKAEIVALSKQHFLLSRETSMIVLENDAMFSAFGIARTRGPIGRDAASLAELDAPSALSSEPGLGLGAGESGGVGSGLGWGRSASGGGAAARVRSSATSVSGRLPPEVIQRIVRQNFGRFRACYERELAAKPSLAGGVTVGFTITTDGSVGVVAVTADSTGSATLAACVSRTFKGLAFPRPEAGTVRVSYPIVFSNDGRPMRPMRAAFRGGFVWPEPVFTPANDAWMAVKPGLDKLRDAAERDPERRSASRALVRGLVAAGQFDEALRAAESLLERDGATASTRELVAEARLLSADVAGALAAFEEMTEVAPASASTHRRVARALESGHEEARACSHWRAAAELDPRSDESLLQALRCRARIRNEASQVLEEAKRHEGIPGIAELVADIRAQKPLGFDRAIRGEEFSVTSACGGSSASCPIVVHVDAAGRAYGELLPFSATRTTPPVREAALLRTVLVGGAPEQKVELTARLAGASRTVELSRGERRTAFAVTLE